MSENTIAKEVLPDDVEVLALIKKYKLDGNSLEDFLKSEVNEYEN